MGGTGLTFGEGGLQGWRVGGRSAGRLLGLTSTSCGTLPCATRCKFRFMVPSFRHMCSTRTRARLLDVMVVDGESLRAHDATLQHLDLVDFAQFAPLLPMLRTSILCMASKGMLPMELLSLVLRHFHPLACFFCMEADATIATLQQAVAEEMGVGPHQQRLWLFSKRNNTTYRPDVTVPPVGGHRHCFERHCFKRNLVPSSDRSLRTLLTAMTPSIGCDHMHLFVETSCPRLLDDGAGGLPPLDYGTMLLLFKFYEPSTATLRYAGHLLVRSHAALAEVFPHLNHLIHRRSTSPLLLYKEVAPGKIELRDGSKTAHENELQDGDIIVFQTPGTACGPTPPFSTVCDLFRHIQRRVLVTFARCGALRGPTFTLELLDVTRAKVASRLPGSPPARRVQLRGFRDGPTFGPTIRTVGAMLATLPSFVPQISRAVSQVVLYEEDRWDPEQRLALMESCYRRTYVDLKCVNWQAMARRLLHQYRRRRGGGGGVP